MCYSQRKELEDSQQSSHKEQVDALWSRLEAASEAHKQQVQQLQEKQQELVMQLEQRDADCCQVSICFRFHKSGSRHTMAQAAAVKEKDAGLMSNKNLVVHETLQAAAAQQGRSVQLLKGTECFLDCSSGSYNMLAARVFHIVSSASCTAMV